MRRGLVVELLRILCHGQSSLVFIECELECPVEDHERKGDDDGQVDPVG